MFRLLSVLILTSSAVLAFAAAPPPADPARRPVAVGGGKVGDLLRKWYAEGTAAGNVGDWYDNRDGEHSPLDIRAWPQLQKVKYTEDDFKMRRNWALQPRVLPHVVFGNSSTSAPPNLSGSNPRSYYCSPQGLALLQAHYFRNNLYIYPEHRDHDPGHNGVGDGYGDLYPTNTPFLLISQGSSGSDQPFMRAMPFVLAAFRPDVKKKLVETGLLMPTVQMIFRKSNKHLKKPEEYFTGKAHPTVFEGAWVDPLAMVEKAHAIRAEGIPPVVRLAVVEEDAAVNGRDFFEPAGATEKLADTPTVIARVYRSSAGKRRMVVKATDSVDVNKRPLTFRWVILRGDPKHVRITPRDRAGTEAEVVIDYHARAPIAPGSAMESNRVDVGVFANNGVHDSAPAFVTSFTLDAEARTYDAKGRVAEIAYGAGATELKILDISKVFAATSKPPLASGPLGLSPTRRKALAKLAETTERLGKVLAERRKRLQEAEKAKQADRASLVKAVAEAEAALNKVLDTEVGAIEATPRAFAAKALAASLRWLAEDGPQRDNVRALAEKAGEGPARRVRAAAAAFARVRLTPDGGESTAFERSELERFAAVVLAEGVMPGAIEPVFHTNFVDGRLATPKRWRDVYRYDGDKPAGWTRHAADGKKTEYTAEGRLVLERDDQGRVAESRPVEYRQPAAPRGTRWVNPNPLEAVPKE